jgi:hypothetical protein
MKPSQCTDIKLKERKKMKDEPKTMSQIEAEITEIEEVINSIEERITGLNARFSHILRKVPDPLPIGKSATEETEGEIVPLAHTLRLFKKRLCFINADILDILNRCEL